MRLVSVVGALLLGAACFDFSDIPEPGSDSVCGDGRVDDGEQCDAGSGNSDLLANACRSSCTFASCGDGVVDDEESCDRADPSGVDCREVEAGGPDEEPEEPGLEAGASCSEGTECAGGSCVDGLCCDVACAGACQSCQALTTGLDRDGTCGPILAGLDPRDACDGGLSCDGQGGCFAKVEGDTCAADSECISGFCTDGACCPSRCGETCRNCSSGSCSEVANAPDPDTCPSCFGDSTCTGRDIGETCVNGTECAGGLCVSNTCRRRSGESCSANSECENNACIGGTCTVPSSILGPCDDSTDCQSNFACSGGFCLVPDGSSCVEDNQCVNLCIFQTCAPQSEALGACESSSDCIDDLFCNASDQCIIPSGSDVRCNNSTECAVRCIEVRCKELQPGGAFCNIDEDCISNICNQVFNECA
ncbi:MAG: hypothetical protein AAF735_02570 [Myxococcota bacterium]